MYKRVKQAITAPIFIFQMGKVGSSSLKSTLTQAHSGLVVHAHDYSQLSDRAKTILRWRKRLRLPVYVICPVREPLSRNMSAFFQNFKRDTGFEISDREWTHSELTDLFLRKYPHNVCLEWFDANLRTTFGLDVFSEEFPTEKKWKLYKHKAVRILVYRSDLDRSAQLDVISEFIGSKITGWTQSNISSDKNYGDMYNKFVSSVRLPEIYLTVMCDSKFCRKFWSDEEINTIKEKFSS